MSTAEELRAIAAELAEEQKNGTWKPAAGDALSECAFIKTGFRSWGLEAPDNSWRLTLSRLDFGDSNPSAMLEVHAPNHASAFGDLGWFVFGHSIGTNGGTNFNQAVKRLTTALGASEADWARRVTYLIKRAKEANAGSNNGTFSMVGKPSSTVPPPYIIDRRVRRGRTISIYGPGSAGKTTIVDGLVVGLCSGEEIIPSWRSLRPFSCLVLDWDEGEEEERVRIAAICEGHGVELVVPYHYKRQTRPLHDVVDEIGAYIAKHSIEIVVVSPMGRAQRNMGENITAPVDEVHEILRGFGTTNILIDHVTGDNMKGGAQREFGSIRKRDNVRGSWAVDVQSEEPGQRVVVVRNTKNDALSPMIAPQAVRIEFDPQWPKEDGTYDRITFHPDQIRTVGGYATPDQPLPPSMRVLLTEVLEDGPLTIEQIVAQTGQNAPSIRTVLNRYRDVTFKSPKPGVWELA